VTSSWFVILQLSQDARSNKHQILFTYFVNYWQQHICLGHAQYRTVQPELIRDMTIDTIFGIAKQIYVH